MKSYLVIIGPNSHEKRFGGMIEIEIENKIELGYILCKSVYEIWSYRNNEILHCDLEK